MIGCSFEIRNETMYSFSVSASSLNFDVVFIRRFYRPANSVPGGDLAVSLGSSGRYSMILIDPTYRPAQVMPVFPPVKPAQPDPPLPLDREIVNFLRDQPEAVGTWSLVNAVAAACHPANRSESRELKLRILRRIRPLVYSYRVMSENSNALIPLLRRVRVGIRWRGARSRSARDKYRLR
jgi:hypothetical protein